MGKVCGRCKEWRKDSEYTSGQRSWCRPCAAEYARHRPTYEPVAGKVCADCGIYKTSEHFQLSPKVRSGLKSRCKECLSVWVKGGEAEAAHIIASFSGKTCPQCGDFKADIDDFYLSKTRYPISAWCRDCARTNGKLARYNIPLSWYADAYVEQDGRCAICDESHEVLVIDHDHSCCPERARSCGLCVRALLCKDCNTGLGHFRDNPDTLTRAVEYLDQHKLWGASG